MVSNYLFYLKQNLFKSIIQRDKKKSFETEARGKPAIDDLRDRRETTDSYNNKTCNLRRLVGAYSRRCHRFTRQIS